VTRPAHGGKCLRYWHIPPTQVVMPGHWASVWQPGTHTLPTQIRPEPSAPGLQSPSVAQGVPPLLEVVELLLLELLELEGGVQHSSEAGPGQRPAVET
jgi:hypothetical protein